MARAWLLTIPMAGLLGAVAYRLATAPAAALAGLILVAVLGGLAVTVLQRAPRPVASMARP